MSIPIQWARRIPQFSSLLPGTHLTIKTNGRWLEHFIQHRQLKCLLSLLK